MQPAWQKNITTWILLALVVTFAIVLLLTAWVSDDAYITLRSVDNFINGYGMTWNISERVQTFTHPLWFFLISAAYFFTREAFYTTIFLSIGISLVTFILLVVKSKKGFTLYVGLSILILSKAFIDYSTSGLENPLTHLLALSFSIFSLELFSETGCSNRHVLLASLMAGLCTLNRMDALLLFIPAIVSFLWKSPRWSTVRNIAIGFLPFILWEIFSLIYYGFPFPNTAYAKLNTLIPRGELIHQGTKYFLNSLRWDPLTLTTIGAGVVSAFISRKSEKTAIGVGIILYLGYIVWMGADFMSGRFFSTPLLLAVILIISYYKDFKLKTGFAFLALVMVLGFKASTPNLIIHRVDADDWKVWIDNNGISDERMFYFPTGSLLEAQPNRIEPHHTWVYDGLRAKTGGEKLVITTNAGYFGYFAGPQIHVIDRYALADPLLARIPFSNTNWRPGHFERSIPHGYRETISTGENQIKHPALAKYYDQLSLITQGTFLDRQRLKAIWQINTGKYDVLVEKYAK